jgi:hypothetical protein
MDLLNQYTINSKLYSTQSAAWLHYSTTPFPCINNEYVYELLLVLRVYQRKLLRRTSGLTTIVTADLIEFSVLSAEREKHDGDSSLDSRQAGTFGTNQMVGLFGLRSDESHMVLFSKYIIFATFNRISKLFSRAKR